MSVLIDFDILRSVLLGADVPVAQAVHNGMTAVLAHH